MRFSRDFKGFCSRWHWIKYPGRGPGGVGANNPHQPESQFVEFFGWKFFGLPHNIKKFFVKFRPTFLAVEGRHGFAYKNFPQSPAGNLEYFLPCTAGNFRNFFFQNNIVFHVFCFRQMTLMTLFFYCVTFTPSFSLFYTFYLFLAQ